jgi:hypothetical protein
MGLMMPRTGAWAPEPEDQLLRVCEFAQITKYDFVLPRSLYTWPIGIYMRFRKSRKS